MAYHPWRALRHLPHVDLFWRDLGPGMLGLTDHLTATIVLSPSMDQAQRRSTLAHELEHILRGPVPGWLQPREERAVDRAAARKLLPDVRAIGEALAWACCLAEAAEELWVDEATLRTRLDALHPAERGYLRSRLSDDVPHVGHTGEEGED